MHLSHATSSSCTNYAKITLVIPVLSDLETWRQSYISLTTKVAIDDKLEEFERAWELLRGESRCRGGGGDKEYQVKDYAVTFSGFYIRFSWKDFVKFDRENKDIVHVMINLVRDIPFPILVNHSNNSIFWNCFAPSYSFACQPIVIIFCILLYHVQCRWSFSRRVHCMKQTWNYNVLTTYPNRE